MPTKLFDDQVRPRFFCPRRTSWRFTLEQWYWHGCWTCSTLSVFAKLQLRWPRLLWRKGTQPGASLPGWWIFWDAQPCSVVPHVLEFVFLFSHCHACRETTLWTTLPFKGLLLLIFLHRSKGTEDMETLVV